MQIALWERDFDAVLAERSEYCPVYFISHRQAV